MGFIRKLNIWPFLRFQPKIGLLKFSFVLKTYFDRFIVILSIYLTVRIVQPIKIFSALSIIVKFQIVVDYLLIATDNLTNIIIKILPLSRF